MSLQLAAQHLQKHGRNGDTMLVHMSPREVKSLSDLAMAHGGHLTINPTTGLPEAGFLSSILPMIAGVGLTAITGGAINPMTAGLLVGGVTGAATGSLSKGLMAGLGAYGGAGLGGALAGAGAGTAEAAAGALGVPGAATGAGSQAAMLAAQNAGFGEAGLQALGQSAAVAPGATPVVPSTFDLGIAGAKGLGTEAGRSAFMDNVGGFKGLLKYGAAAAAPALTEAMEPSVVPTPQENKDPGQRYVYSPGRYEGPYKASPTGVEQTYFTPSYRKISADEAKSIYGYAGGGPVEAMSAANAVGANTGYPMADINKPVYASPWQTPVSTNVVHGVSDTGVNPITGEMTNFADGGVATATPMPGEKPKYTYDPLKQMFNKIESMPSDDQTRQTIEQQRIGGAPQMPMTDAQFAAQQAQGKKNAESLGNFGEGLSTGISGFVQGLLNGDIGFTGPIAKALMGQLGIGATPGQATMAPGPAEGSQGPTPGQAVEGTKMNIAAGGPGPSTSTSSSQGTSIGSLGAMGGGLAAGGLSHLGDYSDGGRLLRGPGDGVSDSIPAMIGKKQPARLADGEFVVPARIVSELGNGSTEAGARKLYAMMDRVQKARGQTVGKGKVAKNSRAERFLPA